MDNVRFSQQDLSSRAKTSTSMSDTSPQPRTPSEEIAGLVERVTFFNEESGFAVLRVKVPGQRDQVTVLGSLPAVSAGEWPGCLYPAVRGP